MLEILTISAVRGIFNKNGPEIQTGPTFITLPYVDVDKILLKSTWNKITP